MRSRMTGGLHLAQFEGQRVRDVALLGRRLADVELPRLAVVVGEALGADALLRALLGLGKRAEAALPAIRAGLHRRNWAGS